MSVYKRVREFIEGEEAKADDIESEFDNIAATLQGGIDSNNIASGGIGAAQLAPSAVGKGQLASGYTRRVSTGQIGVEVGNGFAFSLPFLVSHGLGEVPTDFAGHFITAENWVIALECRIISWDSTFVRAQVIQSSPAPGGIGSGSVAYTMSWTAVGQP